MNLSEVEQQLVLQSGDVNNKNSTLPMYAFGVPGNDWGKRFMSEVPIPEPLLSDQNTTAPVYGVQLQYYLGAAGTGAPVHYHGPAINSLAYGEKVSLLFPRFFYIYLIVVYYNCSIGYYSHRIMDSILPYLQASTSQRETLLRLILKLPKMIMVTTDGRRDCNVHSMQAILCLYRRYGHTGH